MLLDELKLNFFPIVILLKSALSSTAKSMVMAGQPRLAMGSWFSVTIPLV